MGAMGGGAAAGGAAGLMSAMGSQTAGSAGQGALGGTGSNGDMSQQGLGHSGPAGGSASSNNQMALNAISRNANGSGLGNAGHAPYGQPAGSAGLANRSHENPQLAQIQAKQSNGSGEFRAGGVREMAVANASDMKEDPITGVFRTPGSAAAMAADPALSRGGHLTVGQGLGRAPRIESGSSDGRPTSAGADTSTHMANNGAGTRVPSAGPKGSSVELPFGKPRR
jgi:hypothetical protein